MVVRALASQTRECQVKFPEKSHTQSTRLTVNLLIVDIKDSIIIITKWHKVSQSIRLTQRLWEVSNYTEDEPWNKEVKTEPS